MSKAYTLTNPKSLTNKNIVFDIDETLVHTFDDYNKLRELKIFTDARNYNLRNRIYKLSLSDMFEKKGTGTETQMWGVTRPHLPDFLKFCRRYFRHVCVWSAGQYPYVHAICKTIFKESGAPDIIYTWDDCENDTERGIYQKPLAKMYQENADMNETNTFILDDRKTSFSGCNPDNGILIPAYKPDDTIKGLNQDENVFEVLGNWLMSPQVINESDVRVINKNKIWK